MRARFRAVLVAGVLWMIGTFIGGCSEAQFTPFAPAVSSGQKGAMVPPFGGDHPAERIGSPPSSGSTKPDNTPGSGSSSGVGVGETEQDFAPLSEARPLEVPAAPMPPSASGEEKKASPPPAATSPTPKNPSSAPTSSPVAGGGPAPSSSGAKATGASKARTPQSTTRSEASSPEKPADGVLPLGASFAEVAAAWGSPTWQGATPYGEVFWAYERSGKFRRGVYFLGGRAESFVLGAGEGFLDWTVDKNVVPPKSAVFVSYRGVSLRVDPMSQDFGIFLTTPADGQAAVELFVDHAAGDKLLYLRVSRWERILRERLYPVSFRYTPPRPDWLTEALGASPAYGDEAMRTEERFLASLIRDFRLRNGLSSLAWDDAVAEAAKRHSADMETNGFFSHVSPTNGTLADRLARAGVSYRTAGENISKGFDDALEMHVAFLNSPAHRQNVVFPGYTHLGTGMVGSYMTVDFVQR